MAVHRTHIPITTNKSIKFMVGNEVKNLKEGEVWEINNADTHAVNNESDKDRVHLIVDYYPYKGLSESFNEKLSLFWVGKNNGSEFQSVIHLFWIC